MFVDGVRKGGGGGGGVGGVDILWVSLQSDSVSLGGWLLILTGLLCGLQRRRGLTGLIGMMAGAIMLGRCGRTCICRPMMSGI